MDSTSPNLDTLRQLYAQNPVAKAFLDHAARRERDRSETKVGHTLAPVRRLCIFGLSESRFSISAMGRNIRFLESDLDSFRASFRQEMENA